MFVVTRGVLAAGLGVYAAIHFFQAFTGEAQTSWLSVAFALTALAAIVLAVLMFTARTALPEHAAAALAASSAAALVLSLTSGFFGVRAESLQPAALVVLVAELMILAAWAAERLALANDVGAPSDAEGDQRVAV